MSCTCERCIAGGMLDVCSSKCNLVNDPHCPCYSCQQHNLDEYPEDKE